MCVLEGSLPAHRVLHPLFLEATQHLSNIKMGSRVGSGIAALLNHSSEALRHRLKRANYEFLTSCTIYFPRRRAHAITGGPSQYFQFDLLLHGKFVLQ